MKPQEFFRWVVSKSRPRIRYEPDPPAIPGTNIHDEDIERIGSEHIGRKYGIRELAPPGPRLRQLFTNDARGQLPAGDERVRQATAAAAAAARPASTKKAGQAADVERRRRIADLKAQIAALKGKKK